MSSKKIFFATFGIAFSIMLTAFMGLYWLLDISPVSPANIENEGVPILKPEISDTKTILLSIKENDSEFFLLIKLNALQNKISLVTIPKNLHLSKAGKTVSEALEYAGILQVVYDIKQEYDIAVDYHILCGFEALGEISSSFVGFKLNNSALNLPKEISELLLNKSEYMDMQAIINILHFAADAANTPIGLEFLNNMAKALFENNLSNLTDYLLQDLKSEFSNITTNINVQGIDKLKRILTLLYEMQGEVDGIVLKEGSEGYEQLNKLLKE